MIPAVKLTVTRPARPSCSLLASEIDRIVNTAPWLDREVQTARAAIRGSHSAETHTARLWAISSLQLAEAAAWASAVDPRAGATLRTRGVVSAENIEDVLADARTCALGLGALREDLDVGADLDPRAPSRLRQACAVLAVEAERRIERRVGVEEARRLEAAILCASLRDIARLARTTP